VAEAAKRLISKALDELSEQSSIVQIVSATRHYSDAAAKQLNSAGLNRRSLSYCRHNSIEYTAIFVGCRAKKRSS